MSKHAAHPRRADSTDTTQLPAPSKPPAAALAELVHTLESQVPAGKGGEAARRPLVRLMALPQSDRLAALPAAFLDYEQALTPLNRDSAELHDQLRALVTERHPEMLADPAFGQVIEAPYRRANMLSWLLRENVDRAERLSANLSRQSAETERLRQELTRMEAERLVMTRELEHHRALADVGLMTAGVAHDFNNLLQVIAGHTAIALAALSPDNSARESLDQALAATRRASELSRRLLDWAKQDKAAPQPLDLSELTGEVLNLITSSAPSRVLLRRSLASGLPAAMASATDVRRIVLNLVVNAWQAIGGQAGEVRVTTGVTEEREPHAFIEVEDNGCGMNEETRLRIFDPFFTTRGEGHGLGLALVNGLVEEHGGRLEVWSEPGHGARFRVSLPLALPPNS